MQKLLRVDIFSNIIKLCFKNILHMYVLYIYLYIYIYTSIFLLVLSTKFISNFH